VWRYVSGFNIHNGVKIDRKDEKGWEALAQYIIRNPFSLEKIRYIAKTGTVIYRSAMSRGKSKKNFEIFDAEDFLATITQHIPDKYVLIWGGCAGGGLCKIWMFFCDFEGLRCFPCRFRV
jgi:hypothetical protein